MSDPRSGDTESWSSEAIDDSALHFGASSARACGSGISMAHCCDCSWPWFTSARP
jgi:hypothetical protein